jgi:two-component system sensor histidine kinase HydH
LCDVLGGLFIFFASVWIVRRGQQIIAFQQQRIAANEGFVVVGEVASAVAHNLRNPLGSIRTSAELMSIDQKDASFKDGSPNYPEDIVASVDQLERWIRNLLDYARAGARPAGPLELNEFTAATVGVLSRDMASRRVNIVTSFSSDRIFSAVHPLLLEQILRTLTDNAVDAMPNGGDIMFSTRVEPGWFVLTLQDSGSGMSPEHVKSLFTSPTTTKARGVGMGLPLMKRSVDRMGGRSEQGKGTCVELFLPIKEEGVAE